MLLYVSAYEVSLHAQISLWLCSFLLSFPDQGLIASSCKMPKDVLVDETNYAKGSVLIVSCISDASYADFGLSGLDAT